ncbi:hypothetical protein R1sor_007724 [Riccia sorocarpa]|uniref:Uncharacterized protein n=1 Tax=Riccia sorocarpa TaxID=122646 RepID=A0ABD3HRM2_9MARC
MANLEAGRTSAEAGGAGTSTPRVAEAVGEAGPNNNTAELVSALGGTDNFKLLMQLIAETTSQVALTTGNQLLAKFQEISTQTPNSQALAPSGATIDGSRAGTPVSGRSGPPSATASQPPKRVKLDWNKDLLSLPQDQNKDVNSKVRLVAERHMKIWDQWKEQPTEKKQECISELRSFYKGAEVIPDSFFKDKFSAWRRNRRQYMNKNIRSMSAGTKTEAELRKICSEELHSELQKLSQQESMEKLREAQKKKQEAGNVFVHHLGAGDRRLFKEDFIQNLQSQMTDLKQQLSQEKSKKSNPKGLRVSGPGSSSRQIEFVDDEARDADEDDEEEAEEEVKEDADEEADEEPEIRERTVRPRKKARTENRGLRKKSAPKTRSSRRR